MPDLTPEQQAAGIFLDAAGNPTNPDGSPAGILGMIARGGGPQQDTASSGPLFFPHGVGDVPTAPEGVLQNIVQQFGAAPNNDPSQPFWSDVTPAGDTTGTQTIYEWNNAGDPRVDAWYAGHPAGPVEGPDRGGGPEMDLASGTDPITLMKQMLQDIPNAGQGSSLGRAAPGSLFNPQYSGGGADNPSTNNWHLLPYPYNQPGYIMRNGIIINSLGSSYKEGYPEGFHGKDFGGSNQNSPVTGLYSPHLGAQNGFPASYGFRGINYGWPGALWGWGGGGWDMT